MPTNNLPPLSTSFIGREKELLDIAVLLDNPTCRLVTLVGSGGIGKTRLAIQTAAIQEQAFEDGVVFVPLAPVATPDLIAPSIAAALEISFLVSEKPYIQIIDYLREKQLLLVMDNFEHLLEGVGLLSEILQTASGVKIFVTSRERLNLQEEWVFAVDGLSYPTETAPVTLESYGSVQLFLQRARQVHAQFSLEENAQAVAVICRQVEGMPLGLELAASWLRMMSCEQIVAQMAHNLDFLTTSLRNIPERHRSVRNVFEQSWRMLSQGEQAVLMRLSVFRGGFSLDAAVEVAGAALPLLAGLADKSLIRFSREGRYDLHELLRQYTADKLAQANESDLIARRHLDYFVKLANQAESFLFGSQQGVWFDRLETEFDNLRAALTWAAGSEAGLHLAAALGWFFTERTHWNEGLFWVEQFLQAQPNAPTFLRAKALHTAGAICGLLGEMQRSETLTRESLALARAANDRWNMAWALSHMATHPLKRQTDQSLALFNESIDLFRQLGDQMGLTHTLIRLGWLAFALRDYVFMRELLKEASIYANEHGDQVSIAWITYNTGFLYLYQEHNLEQARNYTERSYALFRAARLQIGANNALMHLALIEQQMGNIMRAQVRNKEALIALNNMAHNHPFLFHLLLQIASVARESGELKRAAKLLGAANTFFNAKPDPLVNLENEFAPLRSQLGEKTFTSMWAEGNTMTLKQIMAYVLEDRTATTEMPMVAQPIDDPLSEREREIVVLMAEGLNSREIAGRLVLSVQTIRWYVKIIYSKLDVHSRSEAIARAKALNLLV